MARQKCADCGNRVTQKNIKEYPSGWYCHNCKPLIKPKTIYKICSQCKQSLELKLFGKSYNKSNSWCKKCFREYNKKLRKTEAYKKRRKLYMREYRARKKHN